MKRKRQSPTTDGGSFEPDHSLPVLKEAKRILVITKGLTGLLIPPLIDLVIEYEQSYSPMQQAYVRHSTIPLSFLDEYITLKQLFDCNNSTDFRDWCLLGQTGRDQIALKNVRLIINRELEKLDPPSPPLDFSDLDVKCELEDISDFYHHRPKTTDRLEWLRHSITVPFLATQYAFRTDDFNTLESCLTRIVANWKDDDDSLRGGWNVKWQPDDFLHFIKKTFILTEPIFVTLSWRIAQKFRGHLTPRCINFLEGFNASLEIDYDRVTKLEKEQINTQIYYSENFFDSTYGCRKLYDHLLSIKDLLRRC
jgi:hypothetical protein